MIVPCDDASTAADSDSECSSEDELSDAAAPQRLSNGTETFRSPKSYRMMRCETLGAWWSKEERLSETDMPSTGSREREVRVLCFNGLGSAIESWISWERASLRDFVTGQGEVEEVVIGDEIDELRQSMASKRSAFAILTEKFLEAFDVFCFCKTFRSEM